MLNYEEIIKKKLVLVKKIEYIPSENEVKYNEKEKKG